MKINDKQLERLITAQNHAANINQDIMTITAFFNTQEELENHIKRYEEKTK